MSRALVLTAAAFVLVGTGCGATSPDVETPAHSVEPSGVEEVVEPAPAAKRPCWTWTMLEQRIPHVKISPRGFGQLDLEDVATIDEIIQSFEQRPRGAEVRELRIRGQASANEEAAANRAFRRAEVVRNRLASRWGEEAPLMILVGFVHQVPLCTSTEPCEPEPQVGVDFELLEHYPMRCRDGRAEYDPVWSDHLRRRIQGNPDADGWCRAWIHLPIHISFERNDATLDGFARDMLIEFHNSLNAPREGEILRLRVAGHSAYHEEDHDAISWRRAAAVADAAVSIGYRWPFEVRGFGSERQLCSETSSCDYAVNRRVEFDMLVRNARACEDDPDF